MEHFDPESGQVFRETIVKAGPPAKAWDRRCDARKPRYAPPAKGAESLYAKAMRRLVRNAHALEPETLKNVPTSLVQQIWKAVRRERQESLHVWKSFAGSRHGDRSFVHALNLLESSMHLPMVDYLAGITSTSFSWMTDLSLFDTSCSAMDLKQLPTLVNLQNLGIYHTKGHKGIVVDDRLLQHWALRARDQGAFPALRIMVLWKAPGVTSGSIQYLNHFPSLESLVLHATSIYRKHATLAESYGWSNAPDGRFWSFVTFQNVKSAYSGADHGSSVSINRIKDYIDKRRSESIEHSESLVLTVTFYMRHARPAGMACDLSRIMCFERDPKLHTSAAHLSTESLVMEPTAFISKKKRKLKDGKAVHLDHLLQGMSTDGDPSTSFHA